MNKDNVLANKIIQAWNKMIIVNSKSIPYWQWYEVFLEKFHEKYHKLTNDKDYNFNLFNKPSYMSILDKLIDEHFDTYKIFFEDFKYEEKQYLLSLYKNSNSREDVNMLPKVNLNNKKFIELMNKKTFVNQTSYRCSNLCCCNCYYNDTIDINLQSTNNDKEKK